MSHLDAPTTSLPATAPGRVGPALLAMVVGFAFVASCFQVQNYDVWWHLKTGQLTIQRHGWPPMRDPYSFATGGSKWVNSGWFAQVGMYGLYQAWGPAGLVLAKAAAVVLCVLLLLRECRERRANAVAVAVVLVAAVLAARFRFRVRPAILSGPLCASYLWLLSRHERTGTRWVWLLPALMAAWVNVHPGFPVGFVIMAPYCLAAAWRARTLSALLKPGPARTLALVALACLAAALLNPFGYHPLLYPLRLTSSKAFMQDIGEWAAPALNGLYAPFWLYLAIGLAVVAATGRRLGLSDGVLLLVFGSMALGAVRHVFFFTVVAAPIFAKHLTVLVRAARERWPVLGWPAAGRLAACVPAVAVVVFGARFVLDDWTFPFGFGLREDFIPRGAVDFMEAHGVPNNVCNAYQWGGYLSWRAYPRRQIYIDGRCLVYGEKLYLEWKRAVRAEPGWEGILRDRGVNALLLAHDLPLPLLASHEWYCVYWDDISVVFVRDGDATRPLIERFDCKLTLPSQFETHWSDPGQRVALVRALEQKVARQPDCVTARVLLARGRGLSGEPTAAAKGLAEARRLSPHSATVLAELAYWLGAAKQPEAARDTYRALLRITPRHAVGHYGLAMSYRAAGDLRRASAHLRKAVAIRPDFVAARQRLIEVLRSQGRMHRADEQERQLRRLLGQP